MRPVTIPEAEPFFFRRGRVGALLIHGFTSTPFEVRELGDHLADGGITVFGPTLAGHRTTPEELAKTSWRDWWAVVQAGIATVREVTDTVFAAGISAGAALALHAAAHHPDLAGVVALGTVIRLRGIDNPHWLRLVARLHPFQAKRGGSSISDPMARARHPSYTRVPLRAAASLAEFLDHLWDDLPDVHQPVLMLHARHDSVAPPEDVAPALERLGSEHKSAVWIENSDHIITEDYSKEEVFARALAFIRETSNE
jgi:carboxylesterase